MYQKTAKEVLTEFDSNEKYGLDTEESTKRAEKYGLNELTAKKKVSLLVRFLLQFSDILIIILIVAAVITLVISPHDWAESLIIFIVIIVNAILGVVQEDRAEKSLEALEKMSAPHCKVLRDGTQIEIESKHLVPGDIIIIEAGDFIPADARIIECANLQVDESALTGESVPVDKISDSIEGENLPLGDRKNLLYSSTYVTNGRAKAVVTSTGMNTEIGHIAGMLSDEKKTTTPLQDKLTQVGKVIGFMAIAICVVVFILEFVANQSTMEVRENAFASFKIAVALAVAAIPEGLATVVTIVLAIGVSNMAKEKAIVKKLPAVETLGSTSVVCSDKTGTLTQNKMSVVEVYHKTQKRLAELTEADATLISYFALCSDAKIIVTDGEEKRMGDPTETALIELNNKYGIVIDEIHRISEIPFDSSRKMMTVLVKIGKQYISITKGAPDIILKNSNNIETEKEQALAVNTQMAKRALRVLGLGIKVYEERPTTMDHMEEGLTFLGLVGMIDPSRPEVKDAIVIAKKAGIRTVMITGDHVTTAVAIAEELGIKEDSQRAITSEELNKLSDDELFDQIEEYAVYARVAPQDKVRIVDAWQKKGYVVSMTGDGVNDSPALKRADIGCAMGITGTDVAKEAADMILVDDNFATIITAVKEGRGIYENIQKCVKYLLSSNIGEVVTIFVASLIAAFTTLNLGLPLTSIHLLWINLITDSLPAFGLGMEQPTDDVMEDQPRKKTEGFFANRLGLHIIIEGILIGALTLTAFILGEKVLSSDLKVGQTMAFLTLSSIQLFHAFNVKTTHSVFSRKTFNNKFLNYAFLIGFVLQVAVIYIPGLNTKIFGFEPLNFVQFGVCMGLSLVIVVFMEIAKRLGYRR